MKLTPEERKRYAFPAQYVLALHRELRLDRFRSVSDILSHGGNTLAVMVKTIERDKIQVMIELMISNILEFLDLHKSMSPTNISETARMIMGAYYMITVEDLLYVFEQAKAGRYGKLNYAINGQVIIDWFNQHFSERCEAGFSKSYQEHQDTKHGNDARISQKLGDQNNRLRTLFKQDRNELKNNTH